MNIGKGVTGLVVFGKWEVEGESNLLLELLIRVYSSMKEEDKYVQTREVNTGRGRDH